MAIAWVQSKGVQSSGAVASQALTFDSASTSGNLIACGIIIYAPGTYTVTDSASNSYTQDVSIAVGSDSSSVWHAYAGSGATLTITVTNTSGNKYTSFGAAEFSGVDSGTSPLTNSDNNGGTFSTTPKAGSVDSTSLGNGALYYAALVHGDGTISITPDGGFTQVAEAESASNEPFSNIYQIQGTAGALNPGWTLGANAPYAGCVAVFKASAGGGGGGTVILPWLGGIGFPMTGGIRG